MVINHTIIGKGWIRHIGGLGGLGVDSEVKDGTGLNRFGSNVLLYSWLWCHLPFASKTNKSLDFNANYETPLL